MLNPRGIKLEIYICRPWVKHSGVKLETNHCLPFLILLSHWNRHSTPAHIPSTIQFQRHHLCWDLLHGSELQLKATWTTPFVTEQDPMGPSQERPLLHSLCWSASLKYLDNSIWSTFLSCFPDVKTPHQVGDVNYLMTMSTQPPGLLEPKDYNVNR